MSTPTRIREVDELRRVFDHLRESLREAIMALRVSLSRAIAPTPPKKTLWEERQALIDAHGTLTSERREELHRKAAVDPGFEERLLEGDAVFAKWEALLASDVSSSRTHSGIAND